MPISWAWRLRHSIGNHKAEISKMATLHTNLRNSMASLQMVPNSISPVVSIGYQVEVVPPVIGLRQGAI